MPVTTPTIVVFFIRKFPSERAAGCSVLIADGMAAASRGAGDLQNWASQLFVLENAVLNPEIRVSSAA
jgi:hypothetical protein